MMMMMMMMMKMKMMMMMISESRCWALRLLLASIGADQLVPEKLLTCEGRLTFTFTIFPQTLKSVCRQSVLFFKFPKQIRVSQTCFSSSWSSDRWELTWAAGTRHHISVYMFLCVCSWSFKGPVKSVFTCDVIRLLCQHHRWAGHGVDWQLWQRICMISICLDEYYYHVLQCSIQILYLHTSRNTTV